MSTVLQRLSPGARVAVIRLPSLGDCWLTPPALALLKQARPDREIAVVAEDAFAPVFVDNPDVDRILPPNAKEISRWRPQLTLNLHGGATSVSSTLAARSTLRPAFANMRPPALYIIGLPTD